MVKCPCIWMTPLLWKHQKIYDRTTADQMHLITHRNERQSRLFSEDAGWFDQLQETVSNQRPEVEFCRYISLYHTSILPVIIIIITISICNSSSSSSENIVAWTPSRLISELSYISSFLLLFNRTFTARYLTRKTSAVWWCEILNRSDEMTANQQVPITLSKKYWNHYWNKEIKVKEVKGVCVWQSRRYYD